MESHISRKTSEMWRIRPSSGNQRQTPLKVRKFIYRVFARFGAGTVKLYLDPIRGKRSSAGLLARPKILVDGLQGRSLQKRR